MQEIKEIIQNSDSIYGSKTVDEAYKEIMSIIEKKIDECNNFGIRADELKQKLGITK